MPIDLRRGDCLETMAAMAQAGEQVDSIVTDPPYHLSTVKRFGKPDSAPAKDRDGLFQRASRGFMGKEWDGGNVAMNPETWALAYDVLKPGGHMLVFGGTRTFHRVAVAIEDAGFEIRDTCMWLYGSGFPKSQNVGKFIDKMAGAEREVLRERYTVKRIKPGATVEKEGAWGKQETPYTATDTAPATPEAAEWEGWGTALKPAWEPIIVARKPLSEKSVAANVLAHGTGALNIDGCRIGFRDEADEQESKAKNQHGQFGSGPMTNQVYGEFKKDREDYDAPGRWPANVLHDGIDEEWSRYFYSSKAGKKDRAGSKHPTVKPVSLMAYLCRLVTPPGGTVLDPFAGSGTTGQAALDEGFNAILCEREAEYVADLERRFDLADVSGVAGDDLEGLLA